MFAFIRVSVGQMTREAHFNRSSDSASGARFGIAGIDPSVSVSTRASFVAGSEVSPTASFVDNTGPSSLPLVFVSGTADCIDVLDEGVTGNGIRHVDKEDEKGKLHDASELQR